MNYSSIASQTIAGGKLFIFFFSFFIESYIQLNRVNLTVTSYFLVVNRISVTFQFKKLINYILHSGDYRIYSIKRPGRLLNFWTLRVGAYSRWTLIKFSPFSASNKFILQQNNK